MTTTYGSEPPLAELTEEALAMQAAASNRALRSTLFAELIRRRNGMLTAYLLKLVGPEQAADLAQETWLRIWNGLDRFDGNNFRAWLFRIARNLAMDHHRRRAVRRAEGSQPLDSIESGEATPDDLLRAHEERSRVQACIDRLRQWRPEAPDVVRRWMQGDDYEQTAAELGLSKDQLYKMFHGAKSKLKECLELRRG